MEDLIARNAGSGGLDGLWTIIAIVVAAIIVVYALSRCIRMVQQTDAWIVEFLGTYRATWKAGLHFKIPFLEKIVKKVSLKENVVDFEPQTVITRDNVTVEIDTVVFFQVVDPKKYAYGVNNPMAAIENLTATTLRNVIGDLELDQTLTSRESINSRMSVALDEATDAWGIKINRVELKDITPPQAIRTAMEKQMKAERERREAILQAEGEKQSQILVAEGRKQSLILAAEADKQAENPGGRSREAGPDPGRRGRGQGDRLGSGGHGPRPGDDQGGRRRQGRADPQEP